MEFEELFSLIANVWGTIDELAGQIATQVLARSFKFLNSALGALRCGTGRTLLTGLFPDSLKSLSDLSGIG